jgi:hypothetical protein
MRTYARPYKEAQLDIGIVAPFLTSDMELPDVERFQLSQSLWKKFQDDVTPDAEQNTLSEFLQNNESCRLFNLKPTTSWEDVIIGEVKNSFDNYFHAGPDLLLTPSLIYEGIGLGPGASVKVDSNDFYTKAFASSLTGTSEELYRHYRYAILQNPTWSLAEKARDKRFGHEVVSGSRLSFVPKAKEKLRIVCTEPVLNMFIQKGIGKSLEGLLIKYFGINLSTQPELNRELARKGSVDGSFGTIDLSCASDSVSLNLLREILPPYVLRWLELSRSPVTTLPGGKQVELHMVSSMGNGFTFPLQTLLFATIVSACYRLKGIKLDTRKTRNKPRNFGVFGDDIIVMAECYHTVSAALRLFGFTVNETKSFNCGHFRESCGGDFWKGHDVRGVYLKSLKTRADVYSAINRLVRWSARSGIYLSRTISMLRGQVEYLPVPWHAGDSEGIKTASPDPSLKRDPHLQAHIYYALVKVGKVIRVPIEPGRGQFRKGRRKIPFFYNPDGILIALVGGYIRDGLISVRTDIDRFKVRKRYSSSWGITSADPLGQDGSWKAAVEALIVK